MTLEKLNKPSTVIVIGRAHSGTRILPDAMKDTGIYFGEPLNVASDLMPPDKMYEACRIFGPYVDRVDKYEWSFERALNAAIPKEFVQKLEEYLASLINSDAEKLGWKIPNSNLIYPWLVRLLPEAKFIYWSRHPEGSTAVMMGIDRLEKWNVPCKKFLFHDFNYKMRAISWKYHVDIVHQTPKPKHFLQIRFEDYIANQVEVKQQVETFVNSKLKMLELNPTKAAAPKRNWGERYPFIKPEMDLLGYQ